MVLGGKGGVVGCRGSVGEAELLALVSAEGRAGGFDGIGSGLVAGSKPGNFKGRPGGGRQDTRTVKRYAVTGPACW